MKKLISVFCTIALAAMLYSCNNNDKIIDRYEQAVNEGDFDKATSILYEIDNESLTKEQRMRILDITTGGAASKINKTLIKGMHEMGSAMNDEMDEEDIDAYLNEFTSEMEEAFAPLMEEDE